MKMELANPKTLFSVRDPMGKQGLQTFIRSSHWNNSINSNSNSVYKFWNGIDPQFKFQSWNWCYNSNSNSMEWGDSKGFQCLF